MKLPKTITNSGGEKLTFLRIATDARGEYMEVENYVQPGAGPPMHVHHRQEEGLTVVSGKIGYQVPGGEKKYAGPGESVVFQPGQAHRFWNAGDTILHCTGYIRPADNIIYFLEQMYQSIDSNGGQRPGMIDAAYLLTRYKSEFGMLEIPAPVQTFVFPLLILFGKISGKLKKFNGAPEAVR